MIYYSKMLNKVVKVVYKNINEYYSVCVKVGELECVYYSNESLSNCYNKLNDIPKTLVKRCIDFNVCSVNEIFGFFEAKSMYSKHYSLYHKNIMKGMTKIDSKSQDIESERLNELIKELNELIKELKTDDILQ